MEGSRETSFRARQTCMSCPVALNAANFSTSCSLVPKSELGNSSVINERQALPGRLACLANGG